MKAIMAITFNPIFDDESSTRYGIRRRHAEEVIEKPDNAQVIEIDDLRLTLFTKRISVNQNDHLLLVQSQQVGEDFHVQLAYKIYPDLSDDNIFQLPPLEVLERFVERFGFPYTVANETKKLIFDERISIPTKNFAEVLTCNNHGQEAAAQMFVKVVPAGDSYQAVCALVYILNQTEYIDWLKKR